MTRPSSESDGSLPSSLAFEESLNVSYKAAKCESKSRFVQGREELRPSPNFSKNKLGRALKPSNLEKKADTGNGITSTAFSSTDWSPLDDAIGVNLPSASSEKTFSKEDVNAHIQSVLYGPSLRKRLPVFTEFCPE